MNFHSDIIRSARPCAGFWLGIALMGLGLCACASGVQAASPPSRIRSVEWAEMPVEWATSTTRQKVVKKIDFLPGAPLQSLELHYDDLGQIIETVMVKNGRHIKSLDVTIDLDGVRSLRVTMAADGVPYIRVVEQGQREWLFSGYTLIERGTRTAQATSYITIARYAGRAVIPALESFDHDEMYDFMKAHPAHDLINVDFHGDFDDELPTVDNANWVTHVLKDGFASAMVWVYHPKSPSMTHFAISRGVPSPADLKPSRFPTALTYDFDYFSFLELPAPSPDEIRQRVRDVVDALTSKEIPLAVIDFNRSVLSKRGQAPYAHIGQSNFILNLLVHEHGPLLGTPVLKKVPHFSRLAMRVLLPTSTESVVALDAFDLAGLLNGRLALPGKGITVRADAPDLIGYQLNEARPMVFVSLNDGDAVSRMVAEIIDASQSRPTR